MRFAHLADCHIGGWREEEMKELSIQAFEKAMDICIEKKIEFLLIAGDLFNTSLPSIESMKRTTKALKKLADAKIPVYLIPGSHDFSPSRKTMLDVLENAGLCKNVFQYKDNRLLFTVHRTKEGEEIKITGMVGLAGGLEKTKYQTLANKEALEQEDGFKIFLFHTLLSELKPSKEWDVVPSEPLTLLPKNFHYYGGGHPHFVTQKSFPGHSLITYPGPVSPNNFREIEQLKHGGFFLIEKFPDNTLKTEHIPVKLKEALVIQQDATEKTPQEVSTELRKALEDGQTKEKIVTIRVTGTLKSGKPSDVDFKKIREEFENAYILLKNTSKLKTKEFEEIETTTDAIEDVEATIIKEHLGQMDLKDLGVNEEEEKLITQLMISLEKEKQDGEKNADFHERIVNDVMKMLHVDEPTEEKKHVIA